MAGVSCCLLCGRAAIPVLLLQHVPPPYTHTLTATQGTTQPRCVHTALRP